jgi:sarcosine oxidase
VKHFDAVVIGCGAMGASASYNLAIRGLKVMTLERFGLNHEFGSSHGETRITRLAYYEDPRYVPLLRRALEAWKELGTKSGKRLMVMTGGLMIGPQEGAFVSGVLRSARAHSLPHRILSWREAMDAYPVFNLEEGYAAVHDENAGVLFPEECISACVNLASGAGCTFGFGEQVKRWFGARNGIEVETTKGSYTADRLVVAAGAWTERLLGDLVPLKVERQTPFWFSSGGSSMFSPERMPVFIMEEKSGQYFYGIPDVGRGVKVARNHAGATVDADDVPRDVTEGDVSPVREFVSRRLPNLSTRPVGSTTCLYSNTPDWNFVIDTHPRDDRVVILSACSGHGFKFASVVGEIAADLAIQGKTRHDIAFLQAERFDH